MKEDLELLIGIVAVMLIMFLTRIGCPIRFLTGISCAGCGMSRAFLHLLRGDFRLAFQYHPLVFLMPVLLLIWLFRRRIPKRFHHLEKPLIFSVAALFLLVYIYRLAIGDPVLSADITKGFLFTVLQSVLPAH